MSSKAKTSDILEKTLQIANVIVKHTGIEPLVYICENMIKSINSIKESKVKIDKLSYETAADKNFSELSLVDRYNMIANLAIFTRQFCEDTEEFLTKCWEGNDPKNKKMLSVSAILIQYENFMSDMSKLMANLQTFKEGIIEGEEFIKKELIKKDKCGKA